MALFELQGVAYRQGSEAYDAERRASESLEALEGVRKTWLGEDLGRARELVGEIEEVADEWRSINGDIRNWWTGLRGKFDGGPSTTGSLTGPSDDHRRRLERIRADRGGRVRPDECRGGCTRSAAESGGVGAYSPITDG